MARVLVTGGGGFIGSKVIAQLKRSHPDFTIRAMDLDPPTSEGMECFRGSILDMNDISNAARGCDYVLHLAAMLGVRRTEEQKLQCLNVNTQGTINVLEACVKERVKKVVFMSSSEVYGDPVQSPISEETPVSPKSVYAVSKIAGEEYVNAYHERYGLPYGIVRFFNVYGPGQVAEFVISRFVKAVVENTQPTVYGEGGQVRAFCYVEDAARGVESVLLNEQADGQVFNIGNELEPISMRDLAHRVIEVAGSDLEPRFVEMADSDRSAEREIHERLPDIGKARRVLGYEPTIDLRDGLRRIMDAGPIRETFFEPLNR